jgi:ABC-2 type transport system ATP-binding protein
MIELQHASMWYGQVIGVNDVSCAFPPGITALLGPNGAGKSTMLKLITGQLRPSTGTVSVFGLPSFANPAVFRRLGYCPETESLYDDMTGAEFVTMLATLAGLRRAGLKTAVAESIERVGMTANADRKVGGYSKGMRQRIKVAQAIVHDPDLIIMDEPLNGLDPGGRREITDLLSSMGDAGKCVIVSSHILYEVEQMTRDIVLMNRGRLLAQGDIYQIRALIDAHPHRVAIGSDNPRRLAQRLLQQPDVLSVRLDPIHADGLEVETQAPERFYDALPGIVLDDGHRIMRFDSPDNNLEAVFRYLVNESQTPAAPRTTFGPPARRKQ